MYMMIGSQMVDHGYVCVFCFDYNLLCNAAPKKNSCHIGVEVMSYFLNLYRLNQMYMDTEKGI